MKDLSSNITNPVLREAVQLVAVALEAGHVNQTQFTELNHYAEDVVKSAATVKSINNSNVK